MEQNNYHVSLNHKGVHVCSAVLLKTQFDKLFAITAASCLTHEKAGEYTITFGKARAGEDGDEYCILTKIRLYEDFDNQTLNNDLALLFSDDITKTGSCDLFINKTLGVVLANSTTPKSHVKVTGWDNSTDKLKVIEDEVCSKSDICSDLVLTEKNLTIGSTMLCHGVPNDFKDPGKCRAERGSPVVAVVAESPPVLVAVTSWTLVSLRRTKYSISLERILTKYIYFFIKQSQDVGDETLYPCVATGVFDYSIKKWIENEVEDFASR